MLEVIVAFSKQTRQMSGQNTNSGQAGDGEEDDGVPRVGIPEEEGQRYVAEHWAPTMGAMQRASHARSRDWGT